MQDLKCRHLQAAPSWCVFVCVCVRVCACVCVCGSRGAWLEVLPKGLMLFWLQTRHCGRFLAGCPGTCSTSLQNISGPWEPQVALAWMSAMVARFSTAGKRPGEAAGETAANGI